MLYKTLHYIIQKDGFLLSLATNFSHKNTHIYIFFLSYFILIIIIVMVRKNINHVININ